MYCTHCGTHLPEQAAFCSECGAEPTGYKEQANLNKGFLVVGVYNFTMMSIGFLSQIALGHILYRYILLLHVLGLVGSCSAFIMAYFTTVSSYRTILIIIGVLTIACQVYYMVRRG